MNKKICLIEVQM